MIAVQDLVKVYGRFKAVDGVTLNVEPGEIHGFLGPNGAGKTTTLRMIAGLLRPTSGRILVNNHDLEKEPEAAKTAQDEPSAANRPSQETSGKLEEVVVTAQKREEDAARAEEDAHDAGDPAGE